MIDWLSHGPRVTFSSECSNGTFGENCSQQCHCVTGRCDVSTGQCLDTGQCRDGWTSTSCDKGSMCHRVVVVTVFVGFNHCCCCFAVWILLFGILFVMVFSWLVLLLSLWLEAQVTSWWWLFLACDYSGGRFDESSLVCASFFFKWRSVLA